MPQTACATTATATSFRPLSQVALLTSPNASTPYAKASMSSADGSVKPTQAANMPSGPARSRPIDMPN